MATPSYDVVIVGSGVGGGAVAPKLATTGARVLILERGRHCLRSCCSAPQRRYILAALTIDSAGC